MSRRIARNLARVKPGTLYVGIDLAGKRNTAVVVNDRAQQLGKFGFPNDRGGYDYLLRRVESTRQEQQAPAALVGMEPTDCLWKLVAAELERHQVEYRLVNAYTMKKHREGDQLDRSKDDARDAFMIADLLRTGKYTETRLLHDGYAELREYALLYDRIRRDIRRHKNSLRSAAGQLFPELDQVFKDFTGDTALAMLRNHASAQVVQKMPLDAFMSSVRADLRGSRLSVSKLRRAHMLAGQSVGLHEGVSGLQQAVRVQIEVLDLLQPQLDEVRTGLIDVFLSLPESPYLLSIPWLGEVTAAIILAEIGDPRNYSCAAQLIKLAGTQPTPNTSGRKTRSRTPMSHKGRQRLRTALYFASLRLIQKDDAFAQVYLHFQRRKDNPLTKMQALGAIMNRLLRISWSLMRHQTFYDPALHLVGSA